MTVPGIVACRSSSSWNDPVPAISRICAAIRTPMPGMRVSASSSSLATGMESRSTCRAARAYAPARCRSAPATSSSRPMSASRSATSLFVTCLSGPFMIIGRPRNHMVLTPPPPPGIAGDMPADRSH